MLKITLREAEEVLKQWSKFKEAIRKAVLEKRTQKWMTKDVLELIEKRKQVKIKRDNAKHCSTEISKHTLA